MCAGSRENVPGAGILMPWNSRTAVSVMISPRRSQILASTTIYAASVALSTIATLGHMTRDYADDPRLTAVGLLSEAYLGLHAKLACQIAEHGLSMIEFEILIRLGRTPGGQLRMTDLAAQTSLTASGV